MTKHLMLLTSSILYLWTFLNSHIRKQPSPSGGMVDAGDSKSPDGNIVWVRLPPWAPIIPLNHCFYCVRKKYKMRYLVFLCYSEETGFTFSYNQHLNQRQFRKHPQYNIQKYLICKSHKLHARELQQFAVGRHILDTSGYFGWRGVGDHPFAYLIYFAIDLFVYLRGVAPVSVRQIKPSFF